MRLATLQAIWQQCAAHTEFIPPGQTVNQLYYKDVLERHRKKGHSRGQILQTNGCSIMTTSHVTMRFQSQNA